MSISLIFVSTALLAAVVTALAVLVADVRRQVREAAWREHVDGALGVSSGVPDTVPDSWDAGEGGAA